MPETAYSPPPAARPMAATAKMVAAVVSPVTLPRSRRITPAPRNPMPCTIFEAIRVVLLSPVSRAISTEAMVKSAAPSATQNPVRIPAGRLRTLRSTPIIEPSKAAHARRATIVLRGSMFSRVSGAMAGFYTLQFELRQFREVPCPGVYLAPFEHPQPVQSEFLDGKASQHRAVHHRTAKRGVAQVLRTRQITHKAAREAVARARRVMRPFERKGGHAKYAAFVHHHRAVFAALHHEGRGSQLENMLCRAQQVVLVGELTCLRIVDHQNIDMPERLAQFVGRTLDPVIHRVERDKLRPSLYLL